MGTSIRPNCTIGSNNNLFDVFSNSSIIDDASCGMQGTLNITDPLLGPLADNGGFTLTHTPLDGSPAIDKGNNLICSQNDQRGYNRPFQLTSTIPICDIGSVEVQ